MQSLQFGENYFEAKLQDFYKIRYIFKLFKNTQ